MLALLTVLLFLRCYVVAGHVAVIIVDVVLSITPARRKTFIVVNGNCDSSVIIISYQLSAKSWNWTVETTARHVKKPKPKVFAPAVSTLSLSVQSFLYNRCYVLQKCKCVPIFYITLYLFLSTGAGRILFTYSMSVSYRLKTVNYFVCINRRLLTERQIKTKH